MNHKVAKAYSEMKKSQSKSPKKGSRTEQAVITDVKGKEQPSVAVKSDVQKKTKVTFTRNIADEMTQMTDIPAMEVIKRFTELFEISVFSFIAILKKTVLFSKEIMHIEYVDEYNLEVTASRSKYLITFKNHFGRMCQVFRVKYSDNLSGTTQEYNYRVDVGEDKIPVVSLVSVSRVNEGYLMHGGGQFFKIHISKEDVEYDIAINCDRIRNDPAQVESYINTLVDLNSRDAMNIYSELISRFNISDGEKNNISHSQVMVWQNSKVISMVLYRRGKLDSVQFNEKGDVYTINRNGSWKYNSAGYEISHENGVSMIWYRDGIANKEIPINELMTKVEAKRVEIFGESKK